MMTTHFFVGALIGYITGSVMLDCFHLTGFSGAATTFAVAIIAGAIMTGPVARLIEKIMTGPVARLIEKMRL